MGGYEIQGVGDGQRKEKEARETWKVIMRCCRKQGGLRWEGGGDRKGLFKGKIHGKRQAMGE